MSPSASPPTTPTLYILGGLPGVGKSTLAALLARRLGATYLRIDSIERALGRLAETDIGEQGYLVAYATAKDNLLLGTSVIADCANTIELTRAAWREVANAANRAWVEIEVICADIEEHKRRVELRCQSTNDTNVPSWQSVQSRHYETWHNADIRIDTACRSVEESFAALTSQLEKHLRSHNR